MKRQLKLGRWTVRESRWIVLATVVVALAAVVTVVLARERDQKPEAQPSAGSVAAAVPAAGDQIAFTDLDAQMRELIGYNSSIHLTAEQESLKKTALENRAAACCKDYSAYTCCCECNLSKSIWGLSNYLIAKRGYTAEQVNDAVGQWLAFANPRGFSGDSCYQGGCSRAPSANGCGGMTESKIVS